MNHHEKPSPENAHFSISRDSGVLLFLVSAFGVLASFVYEIGICRGYKLPDYLIQLTTETLLLGVGVVVLFLLFYAVYVFPLLIWLSNSKYRLVREIGYGLISLSIPTAVGFIAGFDTPLFRTLVVVAVGGLVFRYQAISGKKPLVTKDEYDEGQRLIYFGALSRLPKQASLAIFGAGVFLYLVYAYGFNQAFGEKERAVVESATGEPCVVVKRFGDFFVCVEFNPETKTVASRWRLISMDQLQVQTRVFALADLHSPD